MTPRNTRTILALACAVTLFSTAARAQDVVTIDPGLAQKHLVHQVAPQYPADAQAAQVQGTVSLRLSIDTTGRVIDAEVLAGPELLRQAAIDATRQWVYKPFAIGGKPLAAAAQVSVSFTLPAAGAPPSPAAAAPAAAPMTTSAAPPPPPADTQADTSGAMPQSVDTHPTVASTATPAPAGFESATTAADAQPPADARPAPTAKPVFEAGAPPLDTPADASAPKPVFESATPPAEATPPPAPATKPALDSAAPVEAAPATIPPAADATPPAEAASPAGSAAAGPDNFAPLSEECHILMKAHGDVDALISVCGQMAAAAEKFPDDSHYIERRAAYVFDAAALLRAWQYPEAEAMAKRAVAVVEEGHDDVTGASAAYAVLGNAQALNGKLAAADKNLETAEALERKALEAAAGPQQPVYSATLRTILLFHAETLERMGKKDAAAAKRAEAASLMPVPGN